MEHVIIANDVERRYGGDTLDLHAVEADIRAIRGNGEKRAKVPEEERYNIIIENCCHIGDIKADKMQLIYEEVLPQSAGNKGSYFSYPYTP